MAYGIRAGMSPGNASASENVHTAGDYPAVRPGVNVRASVINSLEVMDYERRLKASHVQFSLEACALSDIVEFNKPAESDVKNEDEHTEKTIQNKIIKILSEAVASRASDVHFRLEKVFCKICFRIDGRDSSAKQKQKAMRSWWCQKRTSLRDGQKIFGRYPRAASRGAERRHRQSAAVK
ncbi:PilQ type IV pilus protein [Candidatus Hamiltonella defensa 5AT (Acyrthosiphon pisum)]|uniref:PilQ type IV pilus protein n=1 Tax=Hamiltonella defensa subsp. Acyrthosiphon pisum (strain 5AT) TaxID=572265 RepID=C4K610_HAMD5|nr:PilQ type IV pilus protein [Candidatus Hamiltonella defensa 5AT (Acyrthosiphon pisum)]